VNLATYARRNLFRRRGRTILTIIAVTLATLIFCAIWTFIAAFNAGADDAAADRIATRHKVSITMQLPKHYIDKLREVPGVRASTWANWFGAKDPKQRVPFFAGYAVDHETWFEVQNDMRVPPEQLAAWKQTRNGAIIGDTLAKAFNVKVGDRLTINSDIYPGDWEFQISGIYTSTRASVDRSSLVFHWDLLNTDPRAVYSREHIGWMLSRISDVAHTADISKQIDSAFDSQDDQTLTMSERAFALSFLGGFTALLSAFKIMSLVILLIMTLILANTIAMAVRERTHEYGVLRAIGFPPGHIAGFILGESLLIGFVGGAIGIALVFLIINKLIGPLMAANASGVFAHLFAPGWVLIVALGLAMVLGVIAGGVPAYLTSRLKLTDALRRVD
jgi:putative ABC transport system permease protein